MKKLIICAGAFLTMSGMVHAGCGIKIPVEGKLSKYDAEKKVLTVGKEEIVLMASAEIKDAAGEMTKIEDLLGKEVLVSTDKHTSKAESVTLTEKSKPEAAEKPVLKSNILAESQDWTNAAGTKITAAVQKVEGGKVYFIKDGKVIPYDVPKLSEETIGRLKEIMTKAKE